MKVSKVIAELEGIRAHYGEVECYLQNSPTGEEPIHATDNFFIVPEEYEEEGTCVNIRTWPY